MVATMKNKVIELSSEKAEWYFMPFYEKYMEGKSARFEPQLPETIVVVGCGGNGGYLVPLLARYLATSPSELVRDIHLTLVDGDVIEDKNILRQNFVEAELGLNKAEALADRCNRNFGMEVEAMPVHLDQAVLQGIMRNRYGKKLIIGCVDRHEVRHLIGQQVHSNAEIFYIDVGNELKAGQLFLSGWATKRADDEEAAVLIHKIYPEIAKTDIKKASPSCDIATASGVQRMDINVTAGTLAFKAFCAVMAPTEVPYYEITFGLDNFRTSYLKDLKEEDALLTRPS